MRTNETAINALKGKISAHEAQLAEKQHKLAKLQSQIRQQKQKLMEERTTLKSIEMQDTMNLLNKNGISIEDLKRAIDDGVLSPEENNTALQHVAPPSSEGSADETDNS